ncbi:hypothetical protein G9A89_007455 [Geosiphon pyriformis]|nr:hypothetical protein G9A89_007455 [Geosiphon pyriformis]
MTDYMLAERPSKRAYLGSQSSFYDNDEQFFAAADPVYTSVLGMSNTSSSIMPDLQSGSCGGDKEGTARELSSSGNSLNHSISNRPEALDDAKIAINKGTDASTDVPINDSCKAEPSNHKEIAELNGNKIGKSISSKSPSSTSSQQQPITSPPPPPTPTNNKKRTRATPEQLAILEETFKTNTSPNSKVREALAEKVNMSERSIQIWFQNRRAKMKAMQKRVHMLHEETMKAQFLACMPGYGHNLYPFRMPMHHAQRIALPRSYSANDIVPGLNNVAIAPGMRTAHSTAGLGISMPQAPQGFWASGPMTAPIPQMNPSDHNMMSGFPFSANQQSRYPISPSASPNSNGMTPPQTLRLVVDPSNPTGGIPIKVNDHQVSLSNSQTQQFTPPQEFMTPNFNNDSISVLQCETLTIGSWRRISTTPTDLLCYYTLPSKMFTYHITNNNRHFKMEFPLTEITAIEFQPIDNLYSQIAVEVRDPPNFFMEGSHGQWAMCTDFTEDKQATRHMRHVMKGRTDSLKKQLIKFMQDDPQIAKVVSLHDSANDIKHEIDMAMMCNGDDQHPTSEEQNAPRRSSFPSGSIAENLRFGEDSGSLSDREVDIRNAEIMRQHFRTRRSASVPLSPSDEFSDHSASALNNANSVIGENASSLQINTSVAFLDLFKGHMNNVDSSPDFYSSPMELNSSSPSTPLDAYDHSPDLIHTSPLLEQDPFVTLSQHNLTNLSIETTTNSLFSDELAAALSATNGLPSVTNEDFASMFIGVSSGHSSDGSEFLNFGDSLGNGDNLSSSNHGLGLDSWVSGDVAYSRRFGAFLESNTKRTTITNLSLFHPIFSIPLHLCFMAFPFYVTLQKQTPSFILTYSLSFSLAPTFNQVLEN